MKVGLLIETNVGAPGRIAPIDAVALSMDHFIEEARQAERSGFDGIWVPERHMRPECHLPTPLQLLTILAAETSTVRLGTHALVLTLHNPMQVAEQAAVIDVLSRGRLTLTVAMGYLRSFWRLYGLDPDDLPDRFEEQLTILRLALTGQRFSHEGSFYSLEDVQLHPPAFQSTLPVWVGGFAPPAIRRAGRLGDGWSGSPFPLDRARWDRDLQVYRRAAEGSGHPTCVTITRDAWVGATREEALEAYHAVADEYVDEYRFLLRHGSFRHPSFRNASDITPETLLPHTVLGSPDDCIEALSRYAQDFDVDHVVLRMRRMGGPGFQRSLEDITLMGEEVVGRL